MSPRSPETRARRCPVCGQKRSESHKPFCSKNCADADLARWLSGRYVIPGREGEDAESAGEGEGDGEA
jgi:hypothetical protein